jgi:phosphoadenosine phosphosulfate reductase
MTVPHLEDATPQDILAWALREYAGSIALACSFGGPTGLVALDMAMAVDPGLPVYYLDTGLLFAETHALIERVSRRYAITPIAVRPEMSLATQEKRYGRALWANDPDRCCAIRKLEPQAAFLRGYSAWISGIRRDQTTARASVPVVQWDDRFGLVKVNPFARWDERMVWAYIRAHELPYNELHERSYPSIGCTHCTRATAPGEAVRAGRWPTVAKLECGLHA